MSEWNPESAVLHFGQCRTEHFEKIRTDLGVDLPDEQFALCVRYYSERAKRDPTVGELRLLSRLFSAGQKPSAAAIVQLDTNDARAETYADLIAKRRDLLTYGNTVPVTAEDAFGVAGATLERGGKERALNGVPLLLADRSAYPVNGSSVGVGGSDVLLCLPQPDSETGAPRVGDVYMLIRRGSLSPRAFRKEIEKQIDTGDLFRMLRSLRQIGDAGILPLLLPDAAGLYFDLNRLGEGRALFPEQLAGEFTGDWIAALPKPRVNEFLAALGETGLSGTLFAAVVAGSETVFVPSNHQAIRLETAFLRSLCAGEPISVVLQDELLPDRVSHTPRTLTVGCRYLAADSRNSESVALSGVTVASATANAENSPFRTAVLTALTPVLTAAVSGVDYTDARFAVDLRIPRDPGNSLSAILGVYRVQAELGIPDAVRRLSDANGTAPELTVFAVAPGSSVIPCCHTTDGAGLYLLAAPMLPDGLPDFPALRAMFTELAALSREGKLLAAKVLVNEAATDALRAMRTPFLTDRLTDRKLASEGALPLAVMLESVADLPYARVATVTATDVEAPETVAPFVIPTGNGLVWSEQTEAVILAEADDPDLRPLAAKLTENGLKVSVFTPTESGPLSRAMLTARMVISCAEWQDTPQTAFAREVLERNGGVLVALGAADTIPAGIPHRYFPEGLLL